MYPYKYEPGQRESHPLPVVNPEPQPVLQTVPQKIQQGYAIGQKIGAFITAVVLLTALWFGTISQVGSVTGSLGFDISLWVAGVFFFFYGYILTDYCFQWAEKYCGF